jgi:hypothetical protein
VIHTVEGEAGPEIRKAPPKSSTPSGHPSPFLLYRVDLVHSKVREYYTIVFRNSVRITDGNSQLIFGYAFSETDFSLPEQDM